MNCVSGVGFKNLLSNKKKVYFLLSTSCLDHFMLVLKTMSGTLLL